MLYICYMYYEKFMFMWYRSWLLGEEENRLVLNDIKYFLSKHWTCKSKNTNTSKPILMGICIVYNIDSMSLKSFKYPFEEEEKSWK